MQNYVQTNNKSFYDLKVVTAKSCTPAKTNKHCILCVRKMDAYGLGPGPRGIHKVKNLESEKNGK